MQAGLQLGDLGGLGAAVGEVEGGDVGLGFGERGCGWGCGGGGGGVDEVAVVFAGVGAGAFVGWPGERGWSQR